MIVNPGAALIITLEDRKLDFKPALDVARRMVSQGELRRVGAPELLMARSFSGHASFSLLFDGLDGAPPWQVPLDDWDDADAIGETLRSVHGSFLKQRERALGLHHRVRAVMDPLLDATDGARITFSSIVVDRSQHVVRPAIFVHFEALGADAKLQLIQGDRVSALEPSPKRMDQILRRHERAQAIARDRLALGIDHVVDRTAANVITANGRSISEVLAELEWQRTVEFTSVDRRYRGRFLWQHFMLSVHIEHSDGWQLSDRGLLLPRMPLPESALPGLEDGPLSKLISSSILPEEAQIATAEVSADGHLLLKLMTSHLAIERRMEAGQP